MSLTRTRAIELAQAAPRSDHAPGCGYLDGTTPYCSRNCPVRSESAEYRCIALHGRGGKVSKDAEPYGPCPGHVETYTAPALAPERRVIAARSGYNPRLAELAWLRKPDLLTRYLKVTGVGDTTSPAMLAAAGELTRDQLMAALLESAP